MPTDATESAGFDSLSKIYELIFENAHEGIFLVEQDESGDFQYVEANPAINRMVGIEPEDFIGQSPSDLFEESVARNLVNLYQRVLDSGEYREVTHENQTPQGEIVTRSRLQPVQSPEGRNCILIISQDITELARTQQKLDRGRNAIRDLYDVAGKSEIDREQKLRRLLQIGCRRLDLPYGFLTEVRGGVQKIRQAVGGHELVQAGGTAPIEHSFCRMTLASDEGLVAYENLEREGFGDDPAYERSGFACYIGARLTARDEMVGTICFASSEVREQTFEAADRTFVHLLSQWTSREIERERFLEALTKRAREDGLTGLLNRKTFLEALAEERERAIRYDGGFSLLFLDLDHFKEVNDNFGHWIGDHVLRQTSAILEDESRASDIVGRYGGEEFAIALPSTNLTDAVSIADRMLSRLRSRSFGEDDVDIRITGSIGVTEWTEQADVKTLINRADEGLYEAKRRGRDQVIVATPDGLRSPRRSRSV